ncbi:MAG: D-alanyl-D-alanine carboxypeptidase [Robiginitomaculum sp.]|nr:D-alanyl-D-alanine carboxypeptidase [Robiginitomaculum sp.]
MKFVLRIVVIFTLIFGLGISARAKDKQNKYASIIVDVQSMEILHARQIDGLRYPASLTKMMTLYLVFDALERGELGLDEKLLVSARAARTPPVKLGLRAGKTITTRQAILAVAVMSGNDAAVVLAERLGGSEAEFAVQMTAKAKALGMQRTVFRNANGLPDDGQFTTARDMAKLAEALLRNHHQYYPYFNQKNFTYRGRTYTNHNTLLGKVDGVDGFKTGYTNASGYNLALSAQRSGRRLIAVVLGGASGRSRDSHMTDLIERGFAVQKGIDQKRAERFALNADERKITNIKKPTSKRGTIQAYTLRASHNTTGTVRVVQGAHGFKIPDQDARQNWAVQLGAFGSAQAAQSSNHIARADASLRVLHAEEIVIPVRKTNGVLYRARLAGLSFEQADYACKTLIARAQACLVVAPN